MSDLRTVAQQALTILEAWKHKGMWGDWDGVTDALKAALVEDAMQKFTDVNQELEAALAAPVEPVKQCMAHGECFGGECIYQRPAEPVQDVKGCDVCEHPLYAAIKCRVCGRVTQAKPVQERNFCPRCGKRLQAKSIHTCTPPGGSDA